MDACCGIRAQHSFTEFLGRRLTTWLGCGFINLIEDGDPYDGPPFGPKDPLESFSEALMSLDLPNRTQGQAGAHQGLGPLGLDARAKLALEFLSVHLRE